MKNSNNSNINFLQVGRTVECSECHPERNFYSCKKIEQEHGIKCKCICHDKPQQKIKVTCLSLDCPERTGGECNFGYEDISSWRNRGEKYGFDKFFAVIKQDKLTRIEVINHSKFGDFGRSFVHWEDGTKISLELQDDEKTLKIFIDNK